MERTRVQSLNPRPLLAGALIALIAFAVGGVAILFVPLRGSTRPPPEEVILKSAERFHGDSKSLEGTLTTEVETEGFDFGYEGKFAFIAPDRMDITITSQETTTEILMANGEYYLRLDDEDEWYKLEGDWQGLDPDTLNLFIEARGFLHYGNLADRLFRLEQLPDERVDDRTYLHYWGFIENRDLADVYLTGLSGQAVGPSDSDLAGGPAETHLLLDRKTLLPHRVTIHAEAKVADFTSTQALTFEFAGYGREVAVRDAPAGAKPLVESLQPGGILGLRCSYATKFLRERYGLPHGRGCVVLRVDSPSAAEEAGFELGDKMIEMDGMRITSGHQFTFLFEDLPGTGHHTFVVQRGDQELTLEVDLADRAGTPEEDPYLYYLRARGLAAGSSDLDADFDQIVADHTRQIEQDPTFELPYLYRGDLRIGRNDEAARADLEHALALDPTLTEAHRFLAHLAESQDDFDAAIEHINRSIELNGCGAALEAWDLDCAEDLTNRTAFYLSSLGEGEDPLVQRDVDALEGVIFYEPMLVSGRINLAFARGDDLTVRQLAEQFIDMPLTRLSDYLGDHQRWLEDGILSEDGKATFALPTWNAGDAARVDQGGDQACFLPISGDEDGFVLVYSFGLTSNVLGTTLVGELWHGSYRLATFRVPGAWGQSFRTEFETENAKLPPGSYELRVFVNGEAVKSLSLEGPSVSASQSCR